jgi:DNA topoisomerase-1
MNLKLGKYGAFLACSSYPECKNTKQITKFSEEDMPDNKKDVIVLDSAENKEISLRTGPYGKYVQLDDIGLDKPKRVSIPKFLDNQDITLDIAKKLLALPMSIGAIGNNEVKVNIGKYGPYLAYEGKFIPIPKKYSPLEMNIEDIEIIIEQYKKKNQ